MAKIPDNAEKVFSGVIYDVYHFPQEMFDGSTATFERLDRPDTLMVIAVTDDGKIIMNQESQPDKPNFLTLPGGRHDEGESFLDGAKRELLEETGYAAEDWELYKQFSPITKIDWTIYYYIARGAKKVSDLHLDAGEKIQTKLISFEEFIDIVTEPEHQYYGAEIQSHLRYLRLYPEKLEPFRKQLFGES